MLSNPNGHFFESHISVPGPEHVVILLATYNGGAMLDDQLDSLARQTHADWSLIVSDDGSTDDTLDRVEKFARRMPHRRILCLRGPRQGSAMNFLSLLRAAGSAPYVAFCDQDDVWLGTRLEAGLENLRGLRGPAVTGGRTIITTPDLTPLRLSPQFKKPPSFQNALVQSIAGGNTMLINREALMVLQRASRSVAALVSHDWWVYQMVTGIGGRMIYDATPQVMYRQHGANQVGANDTLNGRLTRLRGLFGGRFAGWQDVQVATLLAVRHMFTNEARASLGAMAALREPALQNRLSAASRARIYRQTLPGSLALWLAILFARI